MRGAVPDARHGGSRVIIIIIIIIIIIVIIIVIVIPGIITLSLFPGWFFLVVEQTAT